MFSKKSMISIIYNEIVKGVENGTKGANSSHESNFEGKGCDLKSPSTATGNLHQRIVIYNNTDTL